MGSLVFLGLVALVAFYAVSVYNRLVSKRNLSEEGFSGIDVQLKRRYDLIPNLVETVKGYAKHEAGTLKKSLNGGRGRKGQLVWMKDSRPKPDSRRLWPTSLLFQKIILI
jgi:hypothetical protein